MRRTDLTTIDSMTFEDVDPLDSRNREIWVKAEHLGRYCFAAGAAKAMGGQARHLDVGCGTGYGLLEVLPYSSESVGIDYSAEALAIAAERLCGPKSSQLHCVDLDSQELELGNLLGPKPFDVITCFEVLEHLESPLRIFKQLCGILSIKGHMLLSAPNPRFEKVGSDGKPLARWHDSVIEPAQIRDVAQACGMKVEKVLGQAVLRLGMRLEGKALKERRVELRPSSRSWLNEEAALRELATVFGWPSEQAADESYSLIYSVRHAESVKAQVS